MLLFDDNILAIKRSEKCDKYQEIVMCYLTYTHSHSYLITQIQRVLKDRKLTSVDEKYFLDAMLCNQPITQEELMGITDIFQGLASGKIRLIDEENQ